MTVERDLEEAEDLLDQMYEWALAACEQGTGNVFQDTEGWHRYISTWEHADHLLPKVLKHLTRVDENQPIESPPGAMGDPDVVTGQQKEMIYLRSLMQGLAEQFEQFEKDHEHWVKENAGRDRYTKELAEGVRKLEARVVACESVAQGFSFRPIAQPMRDQFANPKVWYTTNQ